MTTFRRPLFAAAVVLLAAACGKPHPVDRYGAQKVVDSLSSSSEGTRDWAEKSLAMSEPDAAWPPLANLFQDPAKSDPKARVAAIRIFQVKASYERPLPPPIVRSVVFDPDVEVRRAALKATIAFGDPANKLWLDQASERETDPALKAEIDKAIAGEWKARALEWWRARTDHSRNETESILAIRALGNNGGPDEATFLMSAWDRLKDDRYRFEILIALSRLGGASSVSFIRGQLTSDNPFLRASAAASEIPLKDAEAVETLGKIAASDNIFEIRISAVRALAAIGGDKARAVVTASCKDQPNGEVKRACKTAAKDFAAGATKQAKR